MPRVRVDLAQREVAEDETQPVAQPRLHGFDHRGGLPAVRALVVAVLDQGDGRVGRALGVVSSGQSDAMQVVVLGEGRDEFGISIDAAHEVTSLRVDNLFEFAGAGDSRRLVRGVTAELIGILDAVEILADERFRVDRAE